MGQICGLRIGACKPPIIPAVTSLTQPICLRYRPLMGPAVPEFTPKPHSLGQAARQHVQQHFSQRHMIEQYRAVYRQLVKEYKPVARS